MADDPSDTAPTAPLTISASPPDPPKAGAKTSEFWLKVAAGLLTLGYSTGLIPTTGQAAGIFAMGATMLGAVGYTVCRTYLKAKTVTS